VDPWLEVSRLLRSQCGGFTALDRAAVQRLFYDAKLWVETVMNSAVGAQASAKKVTGKK
jgi:hypothetical protein